MLTLTETKKMTPTRNTNDIFYIFDRPFNTHERINDNSRIYQEI